MARSKIRLCPRRESGNLRIRSIRSIALSVVVLLTLETASMAGAQQTQPLQDPSAQQTTAAPHETVQVAENDSSDPLPSAPTPQPQQAPAQQQETPQQPVGTAAAPYEKPTGVPGSRPAGAVIAPAKQRRVHAIVVRVAIVVAAGAAVGAVVGLSKATHSTPQ